MLQRADVMLAGCQTTFLCHCNGNKLTEFPAEQGAHHCTAFLKGESLAVHRKADGFSRELLTINSHRDVTDDGESDASVILKLE